MNLFSFIFPGRPERYSKKKSVSYKQVGWTAGKKKNEKTMFFFLDRPPNYTRLNICFCPSVLHVIGRE